MLPGMATQAAPPFVLSPEPAASELLAKYFRVLGDRTRVQILTVLDERGELAVGELVEALAVSQPKVSNHLACLRWCGFVSSRRDGRRILYSVTDERVSEVLGLGVALLGDHVKQLSTCRRVEAGAAA